MQSCVRFDVPCTHISPTKIFYDFSLSSSCRQKRAKMFCNKGTEKAKTSKSRTPNSDMVPITTSILHFQPGNASVLRIKFQSQPTIAKLNCRSSLYIDTKIEIFVAWTVRKTEELWICKRALAEDRCNFRLIQENSSNNAPTARFLNDSVDVRCSSL